MHDPEYFQIVAVAIFAGLGTGLMLVSLLLWAAEKHQRLTGRPVDVCPGFFSHVCAILAGISFVGILVVHRLAELLR